VLVPKPTRGGKQRTTRCQTPHRTNLVSSLHAAKPPTERIWFLHTHHPNQGQQHQICTSIDAQPQNLDTPQSNPMRFPRRMPQSLSQRSHALSQPKPSHRKRPHETASSRYLKHHHTTNTIATIRQAGSNRSSRPNCGQRQLDRQYLRAIIPCRTTQSRPFGHR